MGPDHKKVVRVNYKSGEHKEHKEKKDEIPSIDDWKLKPKFKLYMVFIWAGALILTIWYIVHQTQQYNHAVANPTSTVLVDNLQRLPLPQVTVCNWNQNGNTDDPAPTTKCLECELTLISCTYNITDDCSGLWSKRQYRTFAGTFSCYDFNAFAYDVLYSSTTGYSGSYATLWSYPLLPVTPIPTNRAGVQVSFFASGDITPVEIYNEVRFAPTGYDSFYSLQLVNTLHSELPWYDTNYNTTAFDTPVTTVNLLSRGKAKSGNDTIGYAGVSFAYQTLSKQTVYFGIGYTIQSLFGDVSSIIGTACGIDVIKLSVGFCLAFICWKHKSIDLLADLFNG